MVGVGWGGVDFLWVLVRWRRVRVGGMGGQCGFVRSAG